MKYKKVLNVMYINLKFTLYSIKYTLNYVFSLLQNRFMIIKYLKYFYIRVLDQVINVKLLI